MLGMLDWPGWMAGFQHGGSAGVWRATAGEMPQLIGYDSIVPGFGEMCEWSVSRLRLNAVCPYYTMFPLEFPLQQLQLYPDARRVLDPFCGRGTTLFAARLTGREAVGIDLNPVAVAIAQAKSVRVEPDSVVRLAEKILRDSREVPVPQGEFWEWGYHPDTLRETATLRESLRSHPETPTSLLLRALVLGVLHGPRNKGLPSYLSNQMPRTYASKPVYSVRYWRKRNLSPVRVDTIDVIRRRAGHVLADCPPAGSGRVLLGDAASTLLRLRGRFDLVITSPPYYGMRTYVADQWLRNWFVGGPPEVPYGTKGQLAHQPSQAAFVSALAAVWRAVAAKSNPDARLVVRFGAIPSAKAPPEKLILASLRESASGWLVRDVRPVGVPAANRRQAEQFNGDRMVLGRAVDEIDVMAELMPTRRRSQ